MKFNRSIVWLRRDLRLDDNVALSNATAISREVILVFIFDTNILDKLKDKKDRRITIIHNSLLDLDQKIRKKGSALVVLHGDPKKEIAEFAKRIEANAIFANRDYEPYAKKRDKAVHAACNKIGIVFKSYKDHVVFEGDDLLTPSGVPYKVFTPYKNKWLMELEASYYQNHRSLLKRLIPIKQLRNEIVDWSLMSLGFDDEDLSLKVGESAAKKQLKRFLPDLCNYEKNRNYPAVSNGTSRISVHLRFGTLSIRSLIRFAKANPNPGSNVWLSELIWRDFYQMILDQFPYVEKGSFKKQYDSIRWPGSQKHFMLWCEGMTGFPIVDAAMRCFKKTGWMHNRLRMIVASFLTKDLLVDWKKGESWFARNLLDFDLAANNGGWQWCASTGCDAQPYFRIFNPITQSEKFDPEGIFIREFLPELKSFSNKQIHWPHATNKEIQNQFKCVLGKDYPKPIVIHSEQRIKFINLFKEL